jgi:DNA (cytosine-5)-methyltransferase 1
VITLHYYNDNDPYCCHWLRNLIEAGHLPPGDVDERSITDVTLADLDGYTQAHFFCGIAGWPLALQLAGWPADAPVWTGSCPCQPYSTAGKGLGDADPRNLWPAFFRLIRECRPPVVFGEQVASAIRHGWLDGICRDLETQGYACGAAVLGAHSVGAPHIRQRLFWVADSDSTRRRGPERQGEREEAGGTRTPAIHSGGDGNADRLVQPNGTGSQPRRTATQTTGHRNPTQSAGDDADRLGNVATLRRQGRDGAGEQEPGAWSGCTLVHCRDGKTRRISAQPGNEPLAHGIPAKLGPALAGLRGLARSARRNRVGRLRAYGNAIVPEVAAAFIRAYMEARSHT